MFQLIQSEFLHRVFWRELQGIDGFKLKYNNGYHISDLFISHEILSRKFEESDFEDGWKCGGVLEGYIERLWITKDEYIDSDYAVRYLSSNCGDSLLEIIEHLESFSAIYPHALACFIDKSLSEDLIRKFGIQVTEAALEVVELAAFEAVEMSDLEVDVEINANFDESLSWKNLPLDRQMQIFDLLIFGLTCNDQDLINDSEHFLGCMALHPATSPEIIERLVSVKNEVITEILDRVR